MIAPAVVQKIRQFLAGGELSQRKIAARLRVSRGTVLSIARGRRPEEATSQQGDNFFDPDAPAERCRGCGGMVKMPCLLCHIRRLKKG